MIKVIKDFFTKFFKEDDWTGVVTNCKYCGWAYDPEKEPTPTCDAYHIFKLEERVKNLEGIK